MSKITYTIPKLVKIIKMCREGEYDLKSACERYGVKYHSFHNILNNIRRNILINPDLVSEQDKEILLNE